MIASGASGSLARHAVAGLVAGFLSFAIVPVCAATASNIVSDAALEFPLEPLQLAQAAQSPAPLPTLRIGPPPQAKPPQGTGEAAPAVRQPPGRTEQQLQLRVDPVTGRPLSAEELKARENEEAEAPAQPQRLAPRRLIVPRAQTAPQRAAPAAEPDAKPDPEDPEEIVIERLARPDIGSIGVIDADSGGLGIDMWAGSDRMLVTRLIPVLPDRSRSAAVRSLTRRLLLSSAAAPQGRGDSSALLRARIESLYTAGWFEDAAALLRVVPPAAEHPSLDVIRLEILLITGHRAEACTLARNLLERAPTPELKKVAAFCLAVEGRIAEVDLYEQVLYADGIEDPAFYRLLSQMAGREALEEFELTEPSPLHIAMLQATDRWPSEAALQHGGTHTLWALATTSRAPAMLRAEAAERAARRGIISLDTLRTIYRDLPLSAEQEADPVTFAASERGALAAASFYRAIADSQNVEATLNLVEEAWRHAGARGRAGVVSMAIAPHVATIQPVEELAVYAAITMRVLLQAGALDEARAWFNAQIRPARHGDPHAAAAVLEMAPLIYAADVGGRVPAPAQALSIWWRQQNDAGSEIAPQDRAYMLALLEAMGRPIPDSLWLDSLGETTVQAGMVPLPAVMRQLRQAAASGRRAETALLLLAILGNEGPAAATDSVMVELVHALIQVGMSEDAHAFAVESLLVRGF